MRLRWRFPTWMVSARITLLWLDWRPAVRVSFSCPQRRFCMNQDFSRCFIMLDPEAYPLDDREGFRKRVQQRQQIADCVDDLQAESPEIFVEDALDTLEPIVEGDERAMTLIEGVRRVVPNDESDEARQRALQGLREHVAEVYQLHRRMIRNRRATVQDVLRGRAGVIAIDDPHDLRVLQTCSNVGGTSSCRLRRTLASRRAPKRSSIGCCFAASYLILWSLWSWSQPE